jgi:hypothetical protein
MGAGVGLVFDPMSFSHGSGFGSTRPEPDPLPSLLVAFLFTLSEVVTSTCAGDRPLEVVDEDFLEPLPGVD